MHSKLVIVGAGTAGMAAASRLLEGGFTDIIILEAENRIGGRVCTQHFGESCVDLGAQWCHGEKGNVVFTMANPFNLLASSYQLYTNMNIVDSHGVMVDNSVTDWLAKVCRDIVDKASEQPHLEGSLGDYIDKEYYQKIRSSDAEFKIDDDLAGQFLEYFRYFQCSIDGSDSCYDTSVTNNNQYWECEGDSVLNWKDKGYGLVLDLLTKAYPDPSKRLKVKEKVHLGKQVETVNWACDNKTRRVRLTCSDGSIYTADQILITVSLGVLKKKAEAMFLPTLPASKVNAISGLSIGTVDKIFVKFSHSWWPEEVWVIGLLWTTEDKKEFLKVHGADQKRRWLPGIFGFFVDHSQPGLLCGWAIGSVAQDMERCSEREVIEGCQELLERFLGRTYSVPPIEAMLRSTWYSNPNFGGSYSFRSVTTDRLVASAAQLAQPVLDVTGREVILFAGEATHDHYFSTVHGAIESGWREANRILGYSKDAQDANLIRNPSMRVKSCQVLIVGAGMAGLGAAVTLHAAGLTDFIILEAQNHAGGRIRSTFFDGGWLELGAQWIHGENNALFRIAKEHNLLSDIYSVEGLGPHVYEDGTIVDSSLTAHISHVICRILEECEEFVSSSTYPKSVGHFLRQRFSEYLDSCKTDTLEERQLKEDLFDWHVRSLPQAVLELGKQVAQVQWMENLDGNCPPVVVTCNDGSLYCARHVIVTLSLGCLKKNARNLFKPPLPNNLLTTVNALGFGVVDKIFLIYEKPWWPPGTFGFQIIRPTKQDVFDLSDQEVAVPSWLDDLTGFDVLATRPGVLLAWIGGDGASNMEDMTKEDIAVQCTDLLRKCLRRPDIPTPSDIIRSSWYNNPFVCGGYSHTTTECDELGVGPEDLMKPVFSHTSSRNKHPTILCAGEAAHSTHFSTTHGAFETGQKQAKQILDYMMELKVTNNKTIETSLMSTGDAMPPSSVKAMTAAAVG